MNVKEAELNFFIPFPQNKNSGDISPYKIFLVILLKEFLKKKTDDEEMEDDANQGDKYFTPSSHYCSEYRRKFYMTLLKLTQVSDMNYKDLYLLLSDGKYKISEAHLNNFQNSVSVLNKLGVEILFKLSKMIDDLITDTQTKNNSPLIHQSSVMGLFFRRILVHLDKISFQELMDLHKNITIYYEKGMRAITLAQTQTTQNLEDIEETMLLKHRWSVKQAEMFINQQSTLLENDEVKALPPKELQKQIDEIVQNFTPLYSKAYFLSYLNNVRLRDFPNCLKALHRSFDRNMGKQGNEGADGATKSFFQYSLLNLAILHTMFEHNEEAMISLKECIMVAQENGDRVCLQLAQLWLCLLDKKNFQLSEKNIANKTEKSLVRSVSLNIQSLVKVAALSGYLPSKLFDVLVKSDILNCQHSLMNLISNCIAERAALWTLYGKNEMASLYSQLLLNSDLKVLDKSHNGEGLCQALCNVAMWLSFQGNTTACAIILSRVKERFPRYPISKNWMLVEYYVMNVKGIHSEKWSDAVVACDHLYHIDKHLSILQRASLNIARGNIQVALNLVDMLLNEKLESFYRVRGMIMQAMCMSIPNVSAESLLILNRAALLAKDKYLDYEHSIVNINIAYVLLQMNLAEESLNVVKLHMDNVLSNGGIYDKGRVLFLFCQCLIASTIAKEEKLERLKDVMEQLELAITYFTKLECWRKVKAVYMYLAKLYNELGMHDERNQYAYKFRLVVEEHSNGSNENINIFH